MIWVRSIFLLKLITSKTPLQEISVVSEASLKNIFFQDANSLMPEICKICSKTKRACLRRSADEARLDAVRRMDSRQKK